MNKEQAWKEWWLKWPGCIAKAEFKQAFEAGYDAARSEDAEAQEIIQRAAKYYKTKGHQSDLLKLLVEAALPYEAILSDPFLRPQIAPPIWTEIERVMGKIRQTVRKFNRESKQPEEPLIKWLREGGND